MPRFSLTSHCRTCGKEISQSGPARQWVHLNEFYAKADHVPEPRENSPYTRAQRPADPGPRAERKPAPGAPRWRPPEPDERPKPKPGPRRFTEEPPERSRSDLDEAARRLRRLRHQGPA